MSSPFAVIQAVGTKVLDRRTRSRSETATWLIASITGLVIPSHAVHVADKSYIAFVGFAVVLMASTYYVQTFGRRPQSPLNIDLTARSLRAIAVAIILVVLYCHLFQAEQRFGRIFVGFTVVAVLAVSTNSSFPACEGDHFLLPKLRASSRYELVKRLIDVSFGLVLLALLSPLLVVIAALVKLDSPGDALFAQDRIGENGKAFRILKFRTMRSDAPAYSRSPSNGRDPRITRAGRILRRAGLDELPQLINVLRGEMSLVGPRPEMPFIVRSYTPREWMRLSAVPGITGLWQISPARALPIHENLQYDLYYIAHRSFWLDLAIVCRTASSVVRGVGAV